MVRGFVGKPGFGFVAEIRRPSREKIKAISVFPVALVGDGLGRRRVMDAGIKPLDSHSTFCGPAVTVEVRVGDNLMVHVALKLARAGDVVVINSHGSLSNGLWGAMTTKAALQKKLAGVVIDGSVRDALEIQELGLPVFCRGINPCGGGKEGPGVVNFPISCGGISVHPGDIILGDGDGVVVIPRDQLDEAIVLADQCREIEKRRLDGIDKGNLYPEWLEPMLHEKGILSESEELP